ncbi:MAG: hypothetical protein U5K69_04605 [Balneolaceae bacterium]|nr:hypothetical protein [Balneolaceae bacterium]
MEKVKYGIVLLLFAILNSSCSNNSTGTKSNNGDAGSLKVTITTEGPDSDDYDQNGYEFSIENHSQEVSTQDNFTIENLSVGNHTVELNNLAKNCELTNETPIEVEISSGNLTNLDLKIKCRGILRNKIIYIGNSFFEREIFTMDPDGNNKTVITDKAKRYEDLVFSPEGTKIAYTDEDGISIISSENNEPIYNFGGQNDHGPEFSPNGSIILYTSGVGDDSGSYLLSLEEGWPSSRLLSEIGNEYEVQITPTFSPNGEVVAFAARSRNQDPVEHDIYTTNINSNSSPTKLTSSGNNRNPLFTQDGNYIIYQSSISGSSQPDTDLKRINLNNKEITNLTNHEFN